MFRSLSHKPYQNMAVEHHGFKLEILFMFVLVDECSLKLSFLAYIELLDLDLLGENYAVLRHSLEDRFL